MRPTIHAHVPLHNNNNKAGGMGGGEIDSKTQKTSINGIIQIILKLQMMNVHQFFGFAVNQSSSNHI